MQPTRRISARRLLAIAVLACLALGAGFGASTFGGERRAAPAAAAASPAQRIGDCATIGDPANQDACYSAVALEMLQRDGNAGLDQLERIAQNDGRLGGRCHLLMHRVAAEYGRSEGITAANVGRYLPDSSSVNCPAGLTHGLMLHALEGATAATVAGVVPACTAEPSRIKQVNCIHGLGHSFMRSEESATATALALCDGLGGQHAPDCAPGVFHDYFLGMVGDDDAVRPADGGEWDPKLLCGERPARFVRACWLRAVQFGRDFVAAPIVNLPAEVRVECGGLDRVQRDGCVAALGFATEGAALDSCFLLSSTDSRSCLLGMNADPRGEGVLEGCGARPVRVQDLCFSWFGRLHAIFAEDRTDRSFCTALASASGRASCLRGAADADQPLGVL